MSLLTKSICVETSIIRKLSKSFPCSTPCQKCWTLHLRLVQTSDVEENISRFQMSSSNIYLYMLDNGRYYKEKNIMKFTNLWFNKINIILLLLSCHFKISSFIWFVLFWQYLSSAIQGHSIQWRHQIQAFHPVIVKYH